MRRYLIFLAFLTGLFITGLSSAQTAGTLTFSYTPVAHSGTWGEKHVLAIWIQDNSDNFIRTEFRYWGNGTDDHLPDWKASSNENITDATTGATLSAYSSRTFTWDGTDLGGTLLPDGDYKVTIEECWSHGPGNKVTTSYTFTKNESESHLTPEDNDDFTGVTIDWIPSTTGFGSVEYSGKFAVFPNPAHHKIYIDFFANAQNCNIYIVNTLGQEVYSEKEQKTYSGLKIIDVSTLKNGIYFVNIEMNSEIHAVPIVLFK
ncbi:MAG: T9SS type A sorting domain-containing protein [Bacteroidales bacterium]